mgnify:CR=1 FL=1
MIDLAFLRAAPEELSAWREIPLTRALIDMLESETARCEDTILELVRKGEFPEARCLTGKLEAIRELTAAVGYAPTPQLLMQGPLNSTTLPTTCGVASVRKCQATVQAHSQSSLPNLRPRWNFGI